MIIVLNDTNIFDYNLKNKIAIAIINQLFNLTVNGTYRINIAFNKVILNDSRVDEFSIPDKYLPRYLVEKKLEYKEKIRQILFYQFSLAEEVLVSNNVKVMGVYFGGRKFDNINEIIIEINKVDENDKIKLPDNLNVRLYSVQLDEEKAAKRIFIDLIRYFNKK